LAVESNDARIQNHGWSSCSLRDGYRYLVRVSCAGTRAGNHQRVVPSGAEELAETESVDWLPDVIVAGLNDVVIPDGAFAALRAIF
jgi:hypothetical protein